MTIGNKKPDKGRWKDEEQRKSFAKLMRSSLEHFWCFTRYDVPKRGDVNKCRNLLQ